MKGNGCLAVVSRVMRKFDLALAEIYFRGRILRRKVLRRRCQWILYQQRK